MANFNSNSIFPPPKKMNSTCFFIFPPQFLFQGNFPRGFFPRFLTWKNPGPFSTSPESKVSNASCTTNCLAPLTKVCGWTELIRLDGMDSDAVCVVCVGCVFLFLIIFFWRGGSRVVESPGFMGSKQFQEQRVTIQNSWRWNLHVACFVFSSWNMLLDSFDLESCKISMKPKWMMGMLRWSQTTVFVPDSWATKIPLERWRIWDFSVVKPWAVAENSLNRLERNGVATITHKISPIRWKPCCQGFQFLGWKISGIWDFGEIWSHWTWCWPRPVVGSKWHGILQDGSISKKRLPFIGASSPFCPSTLTFQPLPRSCAKTAP